MIFRLKSRTVSHDIDNSKLGVHLSMLATNQKKNKVLNITICENRGRVKRGEYCDMFPVGIHKRADIGLPAKRNSDVVSVAKECMLVG